MSFEKGNTLAKGRRSPKPFSDALRLAINETVGDKTKLRLIADKLVDEAVEGNVMAIKELCNRLEGRPAQTVHNITEDVRSYEELSNAELTAIIREGQEQRSNDEATED